MFIKNTFYKDSQKGIKCKQLQGYFFYHQINHQENITQSRTNSMIYKSSMTSNKISLNTNIDLKAIKNH